MRVFFLHRNDTSVRNFADGMLELNGGVVDVKVMVQAIFHVAENAFARGRWDVGYGDVARERVSF